MNPLAFLAFVIGINATTPKQVPASQDNGAQIQQREDQTRETPRPMPNRRAPGGGDKN